MKKKIELLAPAGEWNAFVAAVEAGADAVYLGGKLFNARQFAGNFDDEALEKAIRYAHVRGVRIYLTLNTLMTDRELQEGLSFAGKAREMGIDAVIVQDLGFAELLAERLPGLELHASTQMTVYNSEGIKAMERLGFKRVVLARELELDEIRSICRSTELEVEVFIHGALCISYSGQCLMSSMIGGRSGNRGKCAQPCRLPYELKVDGETPTVAPAGKFLLSPKDLCSLGELRELEEAGVRSLKIEGRMKSPEYVGTVVGTYRRNIDEIYAEPDPQDMKNLTQIFNRGGFSTGYLRGKLGRTMMSMEKPKNWGVYLGEAVSYNAQYQSLKVRLAEEISLGDGIEVWNGEDESPGTVVTGIRVDGRHVKKAVKGQVAELGNIKGRISGGNRVYKTSDKALNEAARVLLNGKAHKRLPLKGRIQVSGGRPAQFTVWEEEDEGRTDRVTGRVMVTGTTIPEKAVSKPLSAERLKEQLEKTGPTPFQFHSIEVELEDGLSLPVSEINDLRRRALDQFEERKAAAALEKGSPATVDSRTGDDDKGEPQRRHRLNRLNRIRTMGQKPKLSLYCYGIQEGTDYSAFGVDRVYLPFAAFLEKPMTEIIASCKAKDIEVYCWIPSITRGNYDRLIHNRISAIASSGIDGLAVGNPGTLEAVGHLTDIAIVADYTMNIFNSHAIDCMTRWRVGGVTLSPELTLKGIGELVYPEDLNVESLVYGRIPVMNSEYCPVGSQMGNMGGGKACGFPCGRHVYRLKDRMGVEFPVVPDRIDCRSTIFNANVLFLPESLKNLHSSGVDMFRIMATEESPEELHEIIAMHRAAVHEGPEVLDRYEGLIKKLKAGGYTKGHYFRGV